MSCVCDSSKPTIYCCNHCVTSTGHPGTLSNVKINGNPNWKTLDQIQRQIQHTVRIAPSEYIMNKATSTTDVNCTYGNWLSDRSQRHGMPSVTHTRNCSSTHRSRTALRPGVSSAPTNIKGVDVKHFSYQRYLNRIKGLGPLKPNVLTDRPSATEGAKTFAFTITHC